MNINDMLDILDYWDRRDRRRARATKKDIKEKDRAQLVATMARNEALIRRSDRRWAGRAVTGWTLVLLLIVLVASCSTRQGLITGLTGTGGPAPAATASLIVEPQAGPDPYLRLIDGAKTQIDVNSYILTDRTVVTALTRAAARGVTTRILVDGHPYDDKQAVIQEQTVFAGTRVQVKLAAARFTFDHAKYLVVDPNTPAAAGILGSSNLTASGLGDGNREFDVATTDPATVAAMAAVFDSDWNGTATGSGPRAALVLSPGAQGVLLHLIDSAKNQVLIETEEFGDVPAIKAALVARARAGAHVAIILPPGAKANTRDLAAAGVTVLQLTKPYVHAKMILTDDQVFIGSQNFSLTSLDHNREMGIILTGLAVQTANQVFRADLAAAKAAK
ncbi:MAG: phosphatidylserine/phosphatidylglycerophosphate/cardiolipin synthase family protein [Peptococcaceae bacterium]|jgi:phosphatidylserine/phosphatidylglycerophosphate/cardiolipin synthase-like enzyme|nr:phosphatidylserine/phosphatidylglycerophosphate/cardiolipin synthase family protein [Peptococcaceae bacterium]